MATVSPRCTSKDIPVSVSPAPCGYANDTSLNEMHTSCCGTSVLSPFPTVMGVSMTSDMRRAQTMALGSHRAICASSMNEDTTYIMYDEYTTMFENVYSASSGDAAAIMRSAPMT